MRKGRKLLLAAGCLVALLAAILLLWPEPPEPSYAGHPLSYWVLDLGRANGGTVSHLAAIHEIGTNATPFLLKWIQYEPAPWREKAANILEKIPVQVISKGASLQLRCPRAQKLGEGAMFAFAGLGQRALPALPELTRLINDTNTPFTAHKATVALACLGTNGLPSLLLVVQNPSHPCRYQALVAFDEMHGLEEGNPAIVPAIIACLADTNDFFVVRLAARVLWKLRLEPKLVVPALIAAATNKEERVREVAANALGNYGPAAAAAIPVLTNALTDSNQLVRYAAGLALSKIAPEQFPPTNKFPGPINADAPDRGAGGRATVTGR